VNFSFVDPWHLFLPRDGGHVVSLSGSGGKTSMLQVFAGQLAAEGVNTILTCTTRTEAVEGFKVFEWAELEKTDPEKLPAQFYLRDGQTSEGKWLGLAPGNVDLLAERFPGRVILVEADGSACMPLKYYRNGEPVWPQCTSLAVIVMSMAAVGEPAGEVVHRFTSEPFEPLKDLKSHSVWLWDHQLTLLTAAGGYLDQVPADVPVVLTMTCMDQQDDSIGLFDFAGRAMTNERLPLVVFCETNGENSSFRTSCRRDDEDEGDGEVEG
jgi:probable selenium-dependent hydroxylase accessory protein YqeC